MGPFEQDMKKAEAVNTLATALKEHAEAQGIRLETLTKAVELLQVTGTSDEDIQELAMENVSKILEIGDDMELLTAYMNSGKILAVEVEEVEAQEETNDPV